MIAGRSEPSSTGATLVGIGAGVPVGVGSTGFSGGPITAVCFTIGVEACAIGGGALWV